MEYYVLAATAIPAIWVAAGLLKHPQDQPTKRIAVSRTALRLLLATGEVSALSILAVNHDGWLGAWLTTVALAVGAAVVVAKSAATDLRRLRVPHEFSVAVIGFLLLVVFGYASHR